MTEVWKDVLGFEDFLSVSSEGRIHRKERFIEVSNYSRFQEGKIASLSNDKDGYKLVGIRTSGVRKTLRVHRLVAEAFCKGRCDIRNEVNHKNGDKKDNHFKNLEWVSRKENMIHAVEEGLIEKKELVSSNCATCNDEYTTKEETQRYCSPECFSFSKRIRIRPNKEKLLNLLLTKPIVGIASMYDVTDNTIRKWCRFYELPYRLKDIKELKRLR